MRNTNEETGRLHKKIDNLQQLQHIADSELITTMIQSWCSARPDNSDLSAVQTAWLKTLFYINKLEMDRATYSIAYSQLMDQKNKEIEAQRELLNRITDENIDNDDNIPKV